MTVNRRLALLAVMASLSTDETVAFVPTTAPSHGYYSSSALSMSQSEHSTTDNDIGRSIAQHVGATLGAFGLAAAVLTAGSGPVSAFDDRFEMANVAAIGASSSSSSMYSSSLGLAVEIKTMDFSLPSSYDSISDATASGVDALSKTEGVNKAASTPSSSKSAAAEPKKPSMTPEEMEAYRAEQRAKKEEFAAEKAAEARAKAEQTAKERKEQAATKAEKEAQKNAAEEAAAAKKAERTTEKVLKGVEFVDMGLPSYSDSNIRSKSAFSF